MRANTEYELEEFSWKRFTINRDAPLTLITVLHGSADTVARAIIKRSQWEMLFSGSVSSQLRNPWTDFKKCTVNYVIKRTPHANVWVSRSIRWGVSAHAWSCRTRHQAYIFSARQHAERAICYRPSVRPSVRLSVCPSVCLSVTRVDQSKTVKRIIEILSPSDRPNILVFRHQRSLRKSDGFTPNGGAKYKGGTKN